MEGIPGEYRFLDAGDGRRLEQFASVVLDRPAPGAAGTTPRDPAAWSRASARYERDPGGGGRWMPAAALPERWPMALDGLTLELRPTPAGQVGVFPEHLEVARWAAGQAGDLAATLGRPAAVLNLFAYTGLATLELARAGARVAHVDASRPAVAWARRNAILAGLDDRPVRWLVEDAVSFVAREGRRGRAYDGVVLDPPTYGHGPRGRPWRIVDDLGGLLEALRPLLRPEAAFVACTAHATGLDPADLERSLRAGLPLGVRRPIVRELALASASGARLATGWAVLLPAPAAGEGT